MKNWIKRLLGITALELQVGALDNQQAVDRTRIHTLSVELQVLRRDFEQLKSIIVVGVDLAPPGSCDKSWAVICIEGRNDYIQFVDLTKETGLEIKRFLDNFDRRNVRLDVPAGMKSLFKRH